MDPAVTIYVPLLNEGVEVWRPVLATDTAAGTYRIISENEAPDVETWALPTGDIVQCERKQFASGVIALTAVKRAE